MSKAWRRKHTDFMQRFYATAVKGLKEFSMAKPFTFSTKQPGGNIYVQFALPNGGRTHQKSTGTANRKEAERVAMEWLVKGKIPKRINAKQSQQTTIDKMRFFEDLRTADSFIWIR